LEKVFQEFGDLAQFELHFQPFQLYPDLGTEQGVDKAKFFLANSKRFRPDETEEERNQRRQGVVRAWKKEGLDLNDVYGSLGGNVGNSFDAQRLILLSRGQGKENECIEAIYKSTHEEGLCLSERSVLVNAADAAGVTGARQMLDSEQGVAEVQATIQRYLEMGVNAVPVVVINDKFPIQGFPEPDMLRAVFSQLIAQGGGLIAGNRGERGGDAARNEEGQSEG
jgi:predicted DsbA family dithiol-disulfide isomerase